MISTKSPTEFILHARHYGGFPAIRWFPSAARGGVYLLSGPPGCNPDAPIRALLFLKERYHGSVFSPDFYRGIPSDHDTEPARIGIQVGQDTWWVRSRSPYVFEECVTTDPGQDPDAVGWESGGTFYNTRAHLCVGRVLRSVRQLGVADRMSEEGILLVNYLFQFHGGVCPQTWATVDAALPSMPAVARSIVDKFVKGLLDKESKSPCRASRDLIRVAEIAAFVQDAPPGSVLLIPDFDAGLHPFTIRVLVDTLRQTATHRGLTILLEGRSPATYSEFHRDAQGVLIMDPDADVNPKSVGDVFDYEWLGQFILGDLYSHGTLDTHGKKG